MAFKNGAYATVWEVRTTPNGGYRVRMSTSRKNKETGAYEQDWTDWVSVYGTAEGIAALAPRSRIRIGDCAVTNRYDREKNRTYYTFLVFSYEEVQGNSGANSSQRHQNVASDISSEDVPF